MRATFADAGLETRFARDGYLHLPEYFDADEVAALRTVYRDLHPDHAPGVGFASDLDWADLELKRALEVRLAPFWDRVFGELMTPHDSLISGYVVKWPGPEGLLPPHAHFSYVEPDAGRSVVVWVSIDLVAPDLGNGPLRVMPRSHLVADEFFGSGTRPWYVDRTDEVQRGLVTLPTSPGDVVIMDGRLVHGSDPNVSDRPRIAMLSEAVPAGVPIFHPVAVDDGHVELRPADPRVLADAEPGHVASIFAYYHAPEIARAGGPAPAPLVSEPAPRTRRAVRTRAVDEQLLAEIAGPPAAAAPLAVPATAAPTPAVPPASAGGGRRRGDRRRLLRAVLGRN